MMSIFSKMKKTLMLAVALVLSLVTVAQTIPVTGKVTDKDGTGIPSVTISASNKVLGITDGSGNFRINVDKDATITFTSVGYAPLSESLNGRNSIEVTMIKKANTDIGEVTVIGYGTAKKADVVSSVARVSPKDFNKGPLQSVDQLIQGKVAGLNIQRAGNDPNGAANVVLRGQGTLLGSTQPLYVIDGVPGADPSLVAPDDYASVDVLKDASATAIYGTRAANGVILITTKKSKTGANNVNYSVVYGVEKISRGLEVASAQQLRKAWTDWGITGTSIYEDNANTNWQDEITRTGSSQNHNISFASGTSKAKTLASINYYDQKGILLNSAINRLTGRLSTDFTGVNDRVRLGLTIANTIVNNNFVEYGSEFNSPMYSATRYMPTMNVKNPDGSYRRTPGSDYNSDNPVEAINAFNNSKRGNSFQGTAKLGVDLTNWLTYDAILTYLTSSDKGNQYYNDNAPQEPSFQARQYFNNNEGKILENYFTAKKNFDKLSVKGLLGYSWEQRKSNGSAFVAPNALNPAILSSNLSTSAYIPPSYSIVNGGFSNTRKLISFYGRAELNYSSKYLLNVTMRRDGSTVFGKNNKWANFPSVGFAWRVNEESFLKNSKVISDLKLRVGYGTSGEQGIGVGESQLSYRRGGVFYSNGGWLGALQPARNENPDLKWQTTVMTNVGIDWALFGGKVSGTIDVYNKDSKDLLFNYPVSVPPYPFDQITANEGSVNNKGIEFSVNATPYAKRGFSWNTAFNISYNKNEIVSISSGKYSAPDAIRYGGNVWGQGLSNEVAFILRKGLPLGSFFLYEYDGHDQFGNKYVIDKNGNKIFQAAANGIDDQKANYGTSLPKIVYGFNNTFNYKKFDLNVFLRGQAGGKLLNVIALNMDRPGEINRINVSPRALEYKSSVAPRPTTAYLESSDFLRVDNVTLGYTLPNLFKGMKTSRAYINIQNLATFTKYSGIDPEINLGGLFPGADYGIYPRTRTISVGLNLGL